MGQRDLGHAATPSKAAAAITPNMAEGAFLSQVFEPKVAAAEREFADAVAAPASDFAAGGRFATYWNSRRQARDWALA